MYVSHWFNHNCPTPKLVSTLAFAFRPLPSLVYPGSSTAEKWGQAPPRFSTGEEPGYEAISTNMTWWLLWGYSSYTYRTLRNVGALKVANLHCSRQQCVVAEWSGRSVTVWVRFRARVRFWARAREWDFPHFFFSVLKCDKRTLLWHGVLTPQ